MSLVGALAWLMLTMPSICVYVAFLQRQAKAPTIGHIRMANRLLAWINKKREFGDMVRQIERPSASDCSL